MTIAPWSPVKATECLYCAARLTAAEMPDHIAALHRERLEAAATYRRLLKEGHPEPEARAAANDYLRRRLEQGSGRYAR